MCSCAVRLALKVFFEVTVNGLDVIALFLPEINELLEAKKFAELKDFLKKIHSMDLAEGFKYLLPNQKVLVFKLLSARKAVEVFENLRPEDQSFLLHNLENTEMTQILNEMAPDDRAQLFKDLPERVRKKCWSMLSTAAAEDVRKLMTYAEGTAGALMTSEVVELRKEMTARRAIVTLQEHYRGGQKRRIYSLYVTDEQHKLLGGLSFEMLLAAPPDMLIKDLMNDMSAVQIRHDLSADRTAQWFRKYDLTDAPVVDEEGRLLGVVTIDDVVELLQREATEDMQKMAAVSALDEPYMNSGFLEMVKKRAGWLAVLFVGETMTTTTMAYFEQDIARAVVLALFIPLIISSGGNSGSQAASLVIRAMALGEIRLRDWWRVMRREIASGVALGSILGVIALGRITLWPNRVAVYGEHFMLVGVVVACTLVGVVLWGTLIGSMLPFLLRRLGFDPAVSSAPFVATLVDVTGLAIYFSVAQLVLRGTLL